MNRKRFSVWFTVAILCFLAGLTAGSRPSKSFASTSGPLFESAPPSRSESSPEYEPSSNPPDLPAAMLAEHPLARIAATTAAIRRMTVSQIETSIDALVHGQPTLESDNALQLLWTRFGELAGLRALVKAEGSPELRVRILGQRSSLEGWARSEPEAALQWALEQQAAHPVLGSLQAGMAFDAVNRTLTRLLESGRTDFVQDLLLNTTDANLQRNIARVVGTTLGQFAPEQIPLFAAELPAGTARNELLSGFARNLADEDARAAAEWSLTLDPAEQEGVLSSVLFRWRQHDGSEAVIDWLVSQPRGPAIDAALQRQFGSLASLNIPEATRLLDRIPDADTRDLGIAGALPAILFNSPALGLSWAEKLQDPVRRAQSLREAYERWHSVDSSAATRYLENSPAISEAERASLM